MESRTVNARCLVAAMTAILAAGLARAVEPGRPAAAYTAAKTPAATIDGSRAQVLAAEVLSADAVATEALRRAAARAAALAAIDGADLRKHIDALADDTFEGREAGSRGGRAAAGYLGRVLQKHGLAGGGIRGGYYQTFGPQYRNLLALVPGSDPVLARQVIVVGAHYDHVGYGNATNSYGPTGFIHNGADDNASGAAGLLEVAEALMSMQPRPKRSILLALWDGEEKGLLGSRHWVNHPTQPLENVVLMINMDMIGRLRADALEVSGTRTGRGLRQMVSRANFQTDLAIDFTWELRPDSDHYSFFDHGIPVLMLHTGLHEDYHRPSDDSEKLNLAGMERITRLLTHLLLDLSDRAELPAFRQTARRESKAARLELERPLAAPPMRLGIAWDADKDAASEGIWITRVISGSAAQRGGMMAGDRLIRFAGRDVRQGSDLRALVVRAKNPVSVEVLRGDSSETRRLRLDLDGHPARWGLSWRVDDCEPGAMLVTRVVAYSPAAQAGLRTRDRVYQVDGAAIHDSDAFSRMLDLADGAVELGIERQGRLERIFVKTAGLESAATDGP